MPASALYFTLLLLSSISCRLISVIYSSKNFDLPQGLDNECYCDVFQVLSYP